MALTYLISCQVLLNSVQRKSRKCLSQSEAGTAILFFWSARKKLCKGHWYLASCQVSSNNTILVEDVEILLPVKFHGILFSGHRGEVENVSANQRPGWPFLSARITQIGRGHWDLASCKVSLNLVQRSRRRSRNDSANQRLGGHLVPPIDPKNTNVIEDVAILLPVNFVEFHSSVSEEKPRMSQPIRSRVAILFFQSAGKTQPW